MEKGSREGKICGAVRNGWLRDASLIALAFAIGWWGHTAHRVEAQSSDLYFQLEGLSNGTSLALYYPSQQTIYVYPNATVGYSNLNCAFQFRLSQEPGGAIQRQQCKAPAFQP